jgi:hypothetical protein
MSVLITGNEKLSCKKPDIYITLCLCHDLTGYLWRYKQRLTDLLVYPDLHKVAANIMSYVIYKMRSLFKLVNAAMAGTCANENVTR